MRIRVLMVFVALMVLFAPAGDSLMTYHGPDDGMPVSGGWPEVLSDLVRTDTAPSSMSGFTAPAKPQNSMCSSRTTPRCRMHDCGSFCIRAAEQSNTKAMKRIASREKQCSKSTSWISIGRYTSATMRNSDPTNPILRAISSSPRLIFGWVDRSSLTDWKYRQASIWNPAARWKSSLTGTKKGGTRNRK